MYEVATYATVFFLPAEFDSFGGSTLEANAAVQHMLNDRYCIVLQGNVYLARSGQYILQTYGSPKIVSNPTISIQSQGRKSQPK